MKKYSDRIGEFVWKLLLTIGTVILYVIMGFLYTVGAEMISSDHDLTVLVGFALVGSIALVFILFSAKLITSLVTIIREKLKTIEEEKKDD